ncbi:beta-ketoacyl synthase N-terminal-like domain-containing protein [Cystobacter fuscus]
MIHNDNDALDEKATAYFKRLLSKATKLPVNRIDAHAAFESFGIDSVMTMSMTTELEAVFGSLSKTLFFEFQSIHALTQHFIASHRPRLLELLGMGEEKASAPATKAPAQTPSASLARKNWPTRFDAPLLSRQSKPQGLDIAIIGLSGRYPKAHTLDEFWSNLALGRDCITEIPAERWDHSVYFDADKDAPGKTYSKWGGFIDGVDQFDSLFFQISPREAELMDPQERLFLQCVYETIEDAGYTPARLNTSARPGGEPSIGVYVGVMYEEYQLYGAREQLLGHPVALSGNSSSVANRVSYFFNFHGPSMSVDTMCSSSLTAIHLACQSIESGACQLAIAGGVNLSVHPNKYLMLGQGKFVSSKGRCESFGKGGDGYVPGEGVGAVLLKPLSQALRDKDRIYGVIKGVAVNHGGKTNGYSVPSPQAQARSISQAWKQAGIDPRAVSYIEAHGTGTALGDPIEISGLTKAFREHTQDNQFCGIGSVKSNIGHCESAAGISGLTKVLLQMQHGQLVPSLHSAELNPHIDFQSTPFVVQQTLSDWKRPVVTVGGVAREFPRIAGISSFGAGGSNAHLVIEEFRAPAEGASRPARAPDAPVLVVLSARSSERLREKAEALVAWIEAKNLSSDDLPSLAYTLQVGREAMRERLGVIVTSMQSLLARLKDFCSGKEDVQDLFRGQATQDSETLALFSADEEMQNAVEGWIRKQKFARLLGLWVKGVAVDWDKLYGDDKPPRVALPTYPFSRERYWIGTSPSSVTPTQGEAASRVAAAGGEEAPATLVFEESWQPEERPVRRAVAPRTLICLCTDRSSQEELARAARNLDPAATLVFVAQGAGFKKVSAQSYEVHALAPDDCVRAFQDIQAQYGAVDGILHLWALRDGAWQESYTGIVHVLQAVAASKLKVQRILVAGEFRNGIERAFLESWMGFERSLARVLPSVTMIAVLEDAQGSSRKTSMGTGSRAFGTSLPRLSP